MIKGLVVDDEFLGREELTLMLKETKLLEIDEAKNGEEALERIKAQRYDVVFLDIDMPGLSGLDVAVRIAKMETPPIVVFTTAYHQYAMDAFKANAIDYVLKPYQPERLQKMLVKVTEAIRDKINHQDKLQALEKYLNENKQS